MSTSEGTIPLSDGSTVTATLETRQVFSSQHYVENASEDLFENLDVTPEMLCDESREDCVKIDLGTERYEIYPATKARVVVKHYHENLSAREPTTHTKYEQRIYASDTFNRVQAKSQLPAQPTDRDLIAQAKALVQAERTTDDEDFWAAVEWARQAKQHVTFTLPRGKELDYRQRTALENIFTCLVNDDLPGALSHLAKLNQTKQSKSKIWHKVFGRFTVHDRG